MRREQVAEWVDGYEKAWRTVGTAPLAELFAEDATYAMSPYRDPARGLRAIEELWEAERVSAEEPFAMTSEIVAVEGDTAVVRLEVRYENPPREWRDLWLLEFTADGRCRAFEEWPFSPA